MNVKLPNEIVKKKNKEYGMMLLTARVEEVNKSISPQEIKKPGNGGHGNHDAPAWFKAFETRFDNLVEKVDNLDKKVDTIVKVNNLKTK